LDFNFEFYFLQRYCTKVALLYVIEATLLQISNPLADLLRVSEVIGNPLTEGIGNFCKQQIFAKGLPIASNPWTEGIGYPPE
jgi:hypothetical protein